MYESQMYYQSRKGKNEVYRSQGFTDRPKCHYCEKLTDQEHMEMN